MRDSFPKQMIRRRIPQITGIYLAAGWGLLEFSDWATTRFGWTFELTNVVMIGWLVLLPVVLALAWRLGEGPAQSRTPRPASRRSVAVLPFENLSADPDNDYLGEGISDEIIRGLTTIEGLRVASRTSSFTYRGTDKDVHTVGEELSVGAVLEGSVQRAGDRLRVGAQLVNVSDGYQLWSQRFDREMKDVFAIEDEIAVSVADALRILLQEEGTTPVGRIPPKDIRAYEFYLRGRQFFHKSTRKGLIFAREMFERAVEVDPEYAAGYAALADSVSLLAMYYPASETDLGVADRASAKALELAPQLAVAHASRGLAHFMQKDVGRAVAEFKEAMRLDPTLFEARYFYARTRFQEGSFAEAAELFEEAYELREDYEAAYFAGQSYEASGKSDATTGAYRRAAEAVARHLELNPDDARATVFRAGALGRIGKKQEALRWASRALEIDPHDAGIQYNVACVFAVAGETERALDCLEAARTAGFGNREWLEKDPDLASLRGHPRFAALMTAVASSEE